MNFVGMFMYIAVGAIALHYWFGYQSEHKYVHVSSERQVNNKKLFLKNNNMLC